MEQLANDKDQPCSSNPQDYIVKLPDTSGRGLYNFFGQLNPCLSFILPKSYVGRQSILPWKDVEDVSKIMKLIPQGTARGTEIYGTFRLSRKGKPCFTLSRNGAHRLLKVYVSDPIRIDKIEKQSLFMKVWSVKKAFPSSIYDKLIYIVIPRKKK